MICYQSAAIIQTFNSLSRAFWPEWFRQHIFSSYHTAPKQKRAWRVERACPLTRFNDLRTSAITVVNVNHFFYWSDLFYDLFFWPFLISTEPKKLPSSSKLAHLHANKQIEQWNETLASTINILFAPALIDLLHLQFSGKRNCFSQRTGTRHHWALLGITRRRYQKVKSAWNILKTYGVFKVFFTSSALHLIICTFTIIASMIALLI